jgi:predicted AlkP superfamily pyrophosphatase or phosphodiesterase
MNGIRTFRSALVACSILAAFSGTKVARADAQVPNVILFVADGLRGGIVNEQTAPTMAQLLKRGVHFKNSHSVFPTFTTANASVMATGHQLGDTGDFSNTIYTGVPIASANNTVTPFLENDAVLGEVDRNFGGNYLNEETLLHAAQREGYSTATVGKLGPALIFDHTARDGMTTVVLDDSTGRANGIPLSPEVRERLTAAQLTVETPTRGENGKAGKFDVPGTTVANVQQQEFFVKATTEVLLPLFKSRGKPFVVVFWSRDPDGSQHNHGDSLNRLIPGINGPTSLAGIKNADNNLAKLLDGLKRNGLDGTTDVILTSDHGFSTISKESATSWSAHQSYADVVPGLLPPGFVAIDIAHGLDMQMFDPEAKNAPVAAGAHPSRGNALIGADPGQPKVVVATNGGSDLIYLPAWDKDLAAKVVAVLA